MKRLLSILLSTLLLLSLGTTSVFAAEENDLSKIEFSKPESPNYFVYEPGDGNNSDLLTMYFLVDDRLATLASEYYADSDAFCEKYGIYEFAIVIAAATRKKKCPNCK